MYTTTPYYSSLALMELEKNRQHIRHLPNLNIHIEKMLIRIGIETIDDLLNQDEIDIFIKLIKQGFSVDNTLLFQLYGAIHYKRIFTLSMKEKLQLLTKAEKALRNAGLTDKG